MMMRRLVISAVLLATLCISIPFAINGAWLWVGLVVALSAVWISVPPHGYDWTSPIGLFGFTLFAAAGTIRYGALFWMLPGIIATLAAWDLSHLTQRMTINGEVRHETRFLEAHLWQLALTLASSWLLAMLATQVQVRLTFLWALVIITTLMLSLRYVMRTARQTEG